MTKDKASTTLVEMEIKICWLNLYTSKSKTIALTFHKVWNILQLRDRVFAVAAVLLKQGQDVVELRACVSGDQLLQVRVDRLPSRNLRRGVLHSWNRLAAKKMIQCSFLCRSLKRLNWKLDYFLSFASKYRCYL